MKEYYLQAIAELTRECDDISLLDLVYQLLQKSATRAKAAAGTN